MLPPNKKHFACHSKPQKGFALIATVSVMALLLMVALALVSLSTISIRESRHEQNMSEAKANARLALMLALAELQELAGPDQRTSARSDITDGAAPNQKHWTGFWSTENWNPRNPNTKNFLGWGVSHPTGLTGLTDAATPLTTGDPVTMVGKGSVSNPDQHVWASQVPLQTNGSYAWWISDEGIKASFKAPKLGSHSWNKAGLLGTAATNGVSALNLDAYQNLTEDKQHAGGASQKSIDLPFGNPALSKNLYHDVTPQSVQLLTDTRHGGARRDLSTAFELDRGEFDALQEFHASKEQNLTAFYDELGATYNDPRFYHANSSPEIGYLCEVPQAGGFSRGATWDFVRNHYRLYKREWEKNPWARSISGINSTSFAARGTLPHSYSGKENGANDVGGDYYAYHHSTGAIYSKASFGFWGRMFPLNGARGSINSSQRLTVARSPKLTPAVIRVSVALGLVKKQLNSSNWSLAVSLDPYITIINPYNVPVTFESIGLWSTKFNPFKVTLQYTDTGGTQRTATFEKYFSGNYYSFGTFALRLNPNNGPYTLEPGEIRVISPNKRGAQGQLSYNYITTMQGGFQYSEESGFYIAPNNNVRPKSGTTVTATLDGRSSSWGATDRLVVTLEHTKTHNGGNRDMYSQFPPRNMYGDEDIFDQPVITNIGVSANNGKTQPNFRVQRSVNTSQIPEPGDSGLYLGVFDVQMKTTAEDVPSLSLNPRGEAHDTRDYDGWNRSSPQWKVELTQVDDLSQLQLVADPQGHSFWGEGRTASKGETHCVLYQVPELPLSSLSLLQHMNTGMTGSSGSLQIGNSFPHPGIKDLAQIATQRSTVSNGYSSVASQVLTDMAWASNEALWDRYFFSGINWGGSSAARLGASQPYTDHQGAIDALLEHDRSKPWPLQNPRIALFDRNLSASQKVELKEYDKLGRHLAIYGGFNINSTSKNAWKAILSSLRNTEVARISGSSTQASTAQNAFSRFQVPTEKDGEIFGAYKNLSDSQIDALAEAIVQQVKTRGPFIGLADFVNRRLTTGSLKGTSVGAVGALQAAIDSTSINGSNMQQKPTAPNLENTTYQVDGSNKNISNYAGTAGFLQQADILNAIGSSISARSDTFVIRAYGSARDNNGNILAEAWCEATIQRTPDWIQPTDEEPTQLKTQPAATANSPIHQLWENNPNFPDMNRKLGRRFAIQSFRWLAKDEI